MRFALTTFLSVLLFGCLPSFVAAQQAGPSADPFARRDGAADAPFDPLTSTPPPRVPGAPGGPAPIGAAPPASPTASPAVTAAANAPATNPLSAQPILTRVYRFNIPFTLSPPRDPGETPIEVQLHVSGDRGQTWQLYGRQHPSQPNFEFRAGADGEYWFMSRTIDRTGRMRPNGGYRPELRVVVDTKPPRLNIEAALGASGEITVRWDAEDEALLADSLKIEYQPNLRDPWQPVAVELPRGAEPQTKIAGNTAWVPHAASDLVNVRAEIRDRAGNPTIVHRQVKMRGEGLAAAQPAAPGIATQPGTFPPGGTSPPPAAPMSPAPPAPGAVAWPADHVASRPLSGGAPQPVTPWPAPVGTPAPVHPPVASQAVERPNLPSEAPPSLSPTPAVPGVAADPPREPNGLPAGEKPRMTTARRFQLHYDVESVGPQGVAKVELWATRDGGRTWENWGVDPDRASPYPVDVDREGTFGFRIVVYGNNGLSSTVPRAGDAADVWVMVDYSKPVARITSAPYGSGANVGSLEIHWEAADSNQNLGERPVTLKFSELPTGPWTVIAAGLPNNGQYNWRIDARAPQMIYLRLEVRDEAGNVGIHELTEPINTRGLLPKGTIRDFQPIGEETQGAYRIRTQR